MRIFGFLDQKRSKTIQILSQNFDCYGVIKRLIAPITWAARTKCNALYKAADPTPHMNWVPVN